MALNRVARSKIIVKLHKDNHGLCRYCCCPTELRSVFHPKVNDPDTATIDHIVPRSAGGTDDLTNLGLACRGCNKAKGTMSSMDFRAWLRKENKGREPPYRRQVKA